MSHSINQQARDLIFKAILVNLVHPRLLMVMRLPFLILMLTVSGGKLTWDLRMKSRPLRSRTDSVEVPLTLLGVFAVFRMLRSL